MGRRAKKDTEQRRIIMTHTKAQDSLQHIINVAQLTSGVDKILIADFVVRCYLLCRKRNYLTRLKIYNDQIWCVVNIDGQDYYINRHWGRALAKDELP